MIVIAEIFNSGSRPSRDGSMDRKKHKVGEIKNK